MCGLRSLLGPLYTVFRVTSYLRLLPLSILTCSPNMSFLARLVRTIPEVWKNLSWGHRLSHPKETIFAKGLRVRFNLPSSINFRDINGFPLLGVTLESPKWYYWILLYNFLLVINCTRGRILNRFQDIAFDISNIAIFGYPFCV